MEHIGRKMARGAAWMVLFKMAERSLGLISTIILARLLFPADFGLVAMATALAAVLELLGAFSFDVALIRDASAKRDQYDTAWTFNVLAGVGCASLLALIAPWAAEFYSEPRLQFVIYALALASLIQGFENVGVVAFRKELEFHKEFRFLLGKKLVAFIVTVSLAFSLGNYWALVAGILAGRVTGVALSYYAHPYRPWFSLAARDKLFHFSKWLLINNVLACVRDRSADFVVGRISGAHALGIFNIGYEIANLPSTELVAPINRAVYPGYAKVAHVLDELRRQYVQVIGTIMLVVLPAGLGVWLTADLIVPVLLGSKWTASIPVMQILAVAGILSAMQTNSAVVYLALGIPRVTTKLVVLSVTLLIPLLIVLTSSRGHVGAAQAFLTVSLITVWINYFVLFRRLKLRPLEFLRALRRPALASGAMAAVVTALRSWWHLDGAMVEQAALLLASVAAGAATYVGAVILLWLGAGRPDGPEQFFADRIGSRVAFLRRLAANNRSTS